MGGKTAKTKAAFRDHLTRFVLHRNQTEHWFPSGGIGLDAALEDSLLKFFDQVADRVTQSELENRSWKEAERNTLMLLKVMVHMSKLGSPQDILDQMNNHYQVSLGRVGLCPLWPFC